MLFFIKLTLLLACSVKRILLLAIYFYIASPLAVLRYIHQYITQPYLLSLTVFKNNPSDRHSINALAQRIDPPY